MHYTTHNTTRPCHSTMSSSSASLTARHTRYFTIDHNRVQKFKSIIQQVVICDLPVSGNETIIHDSRTFGFHGLLNTFNLIETLH